MDVQTKKPQACPEETADGTALPILFRPPSRSPIAWRDGAPISRDRFLADVTEVAEHLPAATYAINVATDRYRFMVGFAATLVAGQTTLLPPSRIEADIASVAHGYSDCYQLGDALVAGHLGHRAEQKDRAVPRIEADRIAAIPFTSGSTGAPAPHPKRWGELVAGADLALRRFHFALKAGCSIVGTMPPQHMYGLETTVMLPLAADVSVCCGQPFFPADIAAALSSMPRPRILVTTPVHLRACVVGECSWPALDLIISATAPLSVELARSAEALSGNPVMEIYGFTEAGSVASRRTVDGQPWTLYDGMTIDGQMLRAAHLRQPVPFTDGIAAEGPHQFRLLGRNQDLVNVAGKRTSLAHLSRILTGIAGVDDGVFVAVDEAGDRPQRLAAVVVAPGLSAGDILASLSGLMDPLFLPRPLVVVDRLPRTEAGKLRRSDLLAILAGASA
jgi:acyl-coenzyme A synthetase/AMP-(fatty) acid ligase